MRRPTAFFSAAMIAGAALVAGVAMPVQAVAATSQNLENYQLLAPSSAITAGSASNDESGDLVSFQRNYGYQENGEQKTTPAPLKMTADWENKNNEPVSMHGMRQAMYDSSNGDLVTAKDQREDGMTDDEVRAMCGEYDDQSGAFGWFNAVNDFVRETIVGRTGPSCAAYELEPVENYETELPITDAPGLPPCGSFAECGYPARFRGADGAVVIFHTPEFVETPFTTTDGRTRKTGWVIPYQVETLGKSKSVQVQVMMSLKNSTGGETVWGDSEITQRLAARLDGTGCTAKFAVGGCLNMYDNWPGPWQDVQSESLYQVRVGYISSTNVVTFAPWHKPVGGTPYVSVKLDAPPPGTGPVSPVVNNTTNNYYTNGETATCTTRNYRETDARTPQPCSPVAPDDWVLDRTENYQQTPDGSWKGEKQEAVTTPEYQEWKTENPECGKTVCVLDLVLVGVGSCFNLGDRCDGWASDPDKGTKYQCLYGTKDVGLIECELYSRTFNQANRDGGFAYGTDIVPVSSITTPPPSQPQEPPPGADGDTPVTPTPTPTPSPGYTPPADAGGTQGGNADPNGDGAEGCWPTGWAMFNPLEWVLKPIRCAFEPDPQVVEDSFREMERLFSESSMWGVLDGLNGATSLLLTPGGCTGPEVRLPLITYEYVGYPLSACEEPLAGFAAIARVFTMAGAWIACLVSISSSIGGVVGFNGLRGNGDGKS